jgi:hypothetical protein
MDKVLAERLTCQTLNHLRDQAILLENSYIDLEEVYEAVLDHVPEMGVPFFLEIIRVWCKEKDLKGYNNVKDRPLNGRIFLPKSTK